MSKVITSGSGFGSYGSWVGSTVASGSGLTTVGSYTTSNVIPALASTSVLTTSASALAPSHSAQFSAQTRSMVGPSRTIASVAPVASTSIAPITSAAAVTEVPLNVDPNPEIINKKPTLPVHYKQEISLKFLKPPQPEQPGDIVIRQEPDVQQPPAPPVLIRQKPSQPIKPPTVIVREEPPVAPLPIGPKLVVIPGKVLPPPPRKVVVERLPQLPPLPQDVHVERWLGFNSRTRRVRFEPAPKLLPLPAPKNTIIQWAPPSVQLHREFKFLGVAPASPSQYASQFGASLTHSSRLPQLVVNRFQAPPGEVLGIHYKPDVPRLVGDVAALSLINLDAAGLSEYKHLVPAAPAVAITSAAPVTLPTPLVSASASYVNGSGSSSAVVGSGSASGSYGTVSTSAQPISYSTASTVNSFLPNGSATSF